MKNVLIGCGAVAALVLILLCGGLIWLGSGPESGVKLANEMDPYATQYLKDHEILLPQEDVIAYFDQTLMMDGTEAAILTNKRIISHRSGVNTALELAAIDEIKHRHETSGRRYHSRFMAMAEDPSRSKLLR